jgi:5-methylthioadenosine/S-adenosylhomocysteine deaminase
VIDKQLVDLIIEADWIIPVVPRGVVLEHHAVAIVDDRIVAIEPKNDIHQRYHAAQQFDLAHHVLIPGLINLHSHLGMTMMRGLADDLPLMDWLQNHIWKVEHEMLSERFVRDGALLGCAEMLKSGVTSFNDMYFYPQATAEATIQSGLRAHIGLVVLEFATKYANDPEDYLAKGLAIRDEWRDSDLIHATLAPHAPYTVSDKTFEQVMTYAEQLDLPIHLHLHETQQEVEESLHKYGVRPIERLRQLGVLDPRLIAVHSVVMNDQDIQLMQSFGASVCHCPSSNLKLASGIAPITQMLKHGINVGLGTDSSASNNRLDMWTEMRTAALLAKGSQLDASALPAWQALEMATLNAAQALNMHANIGSLEVGKKADICAVNFESINTYPCYDPISHLIYACGREQVSHVWVDGVLQYQKLNHQPGVFAGIEPTEIKEIVNLWQANLNQYKTM